MISFSLLGKNKMFNTRKALLHIWDFFFLTVNAIKKCTAANLHFSQTQEFKTEKYLKFEYNAHIIFFLLIRIFIPKEIKKKNLEIFLCAL